MGYSLNIPLVYDKCAFKDFSIKKYEEYKEILERYAYIPIPKQYLEYIMPIKCFSVDDLKKAILIIAYIYKNSFNEENDNLEGVEIYSKTFDKY